MIAEASVHGRAGTTDDGRPLPNDRYVHAGSVSVLVVDDQQAFRAAAAATVSATPMFHLAGVAETAAEALAFLRSRSVAIVLIDVEMPGMNGVTAARTITAERLSEVVVLLSVRHPGNTYGTLPGPFVDKSEFGPDVLERLWRTRRET